jgi:hypothetical protein
VSRSSSRCGRLPPHSRAPESSRRSPSRSRASARLRLRSRRRRRVANEGANRETPAGRWRPRNRRDAPLLRRREKSSSLPVDSSSSIGRFGPSGFLLPRPCESRPTSSRRRDVRPRFGILRGPRGAIAVSGSRTESASSKSIGDRSRGTSPSRFLANCRFRYFGEEVRYDQESRSKAMRVLELGAVVRPSSRPRRRRRRGRGGMPSGSVRPGPLSAGEGRSAARNRGDPCSDRTHGLGAPVRENDRVPIARASSR